MNRRNFVRTIVAGATVAGVPFERVYSQAPIGDSAVRTNRRHIVREPAHQLRDGHKFPLPPPAEFKDVVIVGAGANSMVAAYHLPDLEVVCLEKEARCGGNAQRSKWRGIYFTEGAAYTGVESLLVDFMQSEFGICADPGAKQYRLHCRTARFIPDFYQTGFDKLPFDEATRQSILSIPRHLQRYRQPPASRALMSLYRGEPVADHCSERPEIETLESMSFEQWLTDNDFPAEVIEWCDAYCPTDVSAYPRGHVRTQWCRVDGQHRRLRRIGDLSRRSGQNGGSARNRCPFAGCQPGPERHFRRFGRKHDQMAGMLT